MTTTLFDDYLSYVDKTESPIVFHRWSLLTCLGAALGRQYYFPFGEFKIHGNMYVMLLGDPGTRKSTAIKTARKLLSATGYETFSGDRTSKEKFLLDLEGVEDETGKVVNKNAIMTTLFGEDGTLGEAKEVFVCADEFNEFVGPSNLEFLSLLGSLWDWDDESRPFKQRLKTSRSVSIYQPTISILSGNTHAAFSEAFPPQALGQGFLSRLLLIYGESAVKKIPFPEPPDERLRNSLVDRILAIRRDVRGEATLTGKAKDMLTTIYHSFKGLEDARFKHYSTRRFTHLLKLCLLCSAGRLRTEIGAEDVLLANTLLTFVEHKMPLALGEFGKAKHADVAGRILSILNEAAAPTTLVALWKQVQSDLDNQQDLSKLLMNLAQAGKIQWHEAKHGGTSGYLIKKKLLGNQHVYVDFSLLKEAKL